MPIRRIAFAVLTFAFLNLAVVIHARADVFQLISPAQLTPGGTTHTFPSPLPNPLFVTVAASGSGGANTLGFVCNACTSFVNLTDGGQQFLSGNGNLIGIGFQNFVSEFGVYLRNSSGAPLIFRVNLDDQVYNPIDLGNGLFFVGARSDRVIYSVIILNPAYAGFDAGLGPSFDISPVTFINAPPGAEVPEPATLLLLATGLAGTATRAFKKRKAHKQE